MTVFLDTNIFLRYLVKDNITRVELKECQDIFSSIKNKKFAALTSSHVFSEIVWTLRSYYDFKKEAIIESLQVFLATGIDLDDRININFSLAFFEQHNLKFIDCLIASNPDIFSGQLPVVSYDKDFDKLPVKRLEPKEVLKKLK
jgi:predicted nucleic-acid-binding protein